MLGSYPHIGFQRRVIVNSILFISRSGSDV